MVADIILSKNTQPIKNGSIIVGCTFTGKYSQLNTVVSNIPDINTIATKYDNRFDNIHYYYGGGSVNGGVYTGEIDGGDA